MDFIINNITLILDISKNHLQENSFIIIKDSLITKIGQGTIPKEYHSYTLIDGHNNYLMPGMVNTHTHASMSLFRGLGEGHKDRLTKFMFPLEKATVSKELVFLAGLYGLAEMITHGVTAFCDMYYFEDEVGKAAELLGIRGIIGETIINFQAPDTTKAYGGLELAHQSAEYWKDNQLISFAYAPHAPYTVEPQIIKEIIHATKKTNSLFTMHVAEFENEWDRVHAIADIKDNESIIEYLDRHELLHPHSIFAHCINVSSNDIDILHQNNIHIAHCPIANAKSGKGIAPIEQMKNKDMIIGLATDGPMSGNRLSLRDVLSYSYSMAKLRSHNSASLSPYDILYLATEGGYKTLGISDGGKLKEGYKADFVLIDKDDIGMNPNYEPITNIIFSISDRAYLSTWVNGIKIAENGIPTNCDWELYKKEINKLTNSLNSFIKTL